MNAFSVILKILATLAVIAGIVFVVVVYGDKIMSLARKLLSRLGCRKGCDDSDFVDDSDLEDDEFFVDDQDLED